MKIRVLPLFLGMFMAFAVLAAAVPTIETPMNIESDEEVNEIIEPVQALPTPHGTRGLTIDGTIMDGAYPTVNITNWANFLTIGVKFDVFYDCTVDKLGIYTDNTYYVVYNLRLWYADTQTLIASKNYPFLVSNMWAWFDIPPVTLYEGDTYIVSARVLSSSINCIDNPGPTPGGVIEPTEFVYDLGNGFPSTLYSSDILPLVDIHYFVEPNTLVGNQVEVSLGSGITVTFQEVTSDGTTTGRVKDSGPQPSQGFKMVPTNPNRYYEIRTSAGYTGDIEIRIKYQETWIPLGMNEADLRIWHYDSPNWIDVTEPDFPDTVNNFLQGNVNSLSYFVLAIPTNNPKDLKEDAINQLENAKTGDHIIDKKIDKIIGYIERSLNDRLWEDDLHLDTQQGHNVFDRDKATLKKIQELIKHKETPESVKGACNEAIEKLVKASEMLAKKAIEEAKGYLGTSKQVDHHISIAEEEFESALEMLARGQPDKAIDHFKKAWEHAQLAIFLATK